MVFFIVFLFIAQANKCKLELLTLLSPKQNFVSIVLCNLYKTTPVIDCWINAGFKIVRYKKDGHFLKSGFESLE